MHQMSNRHQRGDPPGADHASPEGFAPMPPRYQTAPWRYNTRVALAVVPSILMLAGAGGGILLGTLLVGLMISYILDVLKMVEGALVSVWATLIGVYLAMLIASDLFSSARPTSVSFLLLVANGQNLFLTGVWASLQVRARETRPRQNRKKKKENPPATLSHLPCFFHVISFLFSS